MGGFITGVHAVVQLDHSIVTSNVENCTPVTAFNKDNLHRFSSEDLERQTPANCRILQAGYVWEFLQDEQANHQMTQFPVSYLCARCTVEWTPRCCLQLQTHRLKTRLWDRQSGQHAQQQSWLGHSYTLRDLQNHLLVVRSFLHFADCLMKWTHHH